MFADHLTHLYITPHPLIFGKGIKLFETYEKEIKLKYEKKIPVFPEKGVFQYQFKISH
jgi:dihydrofolate reductase